jgi:hypothetical protein
MTWLLAGATLLSLLPIGSPAADNTHELKRAHLSRSIDSQQLMTESIHVLGGVRNRVPRWTGDVRLAVIGVSDDTGVAEKIRSLAYSIGLYTGLRWQIRWHSVGSTSDYVAAVNRAPAVTQLLCSDIENTDCANFLIVVTSQAAMHEITQVLSMRPIYQRATARKEMVACFFAPGVSANFEIKQSVVFVNNTLDTEMQKTCLQEEMYQSFGLFNDYSGSAYYSFNNYVGVKALTVFDKILLSSLYDRSRSTGAMASSVARAVVEYCRGGC